MSLIKLVFIMIFAYGKSKDLPKRTQSDRLLELKRLKLRMIENMMVIKDD